MVRRLFYIIAGIVGFVLFSGCAPAPRYCPPVSIPKAEKKTISKKTLHKEEKKSSSKTEGKSISRKNREKNSLLGTINYYLGTPYKYGGEDESGMDCSGFVQTVFREALGIKLPRTVAQQWKSTTPIPDDELAFGDLVFFRTSRRKTPSHIGIYIGANRFAHASSSLGVTISSLNDPYWRKRYAGARRVIPRN